MRRSNGNECLCNRLVRRLIRLSQREIGSDLYPGRTKPAIDSPIEDGMSKSLRGLARVFSLKTYALTKTTKELNLIY